MPGSAEAHRLARPPAPDDEARPLFGERSLVRRVNGEGALLLGGGRALLMQIAHPLVARGVAEHSDFEADRLGRLLRTLRPVYAISFGTEVQARAAATRVGRRHQAVTGSGYRATDPDLLLWVHATLIDSALLTYERFIAPLSPEDAEQYYRETALIADLFGVPPSLLPADLEVFRAYVAEQVQQLVVSEEARRIAGTIFAPSPLWLAPALLVAREATAGLLPPRLRDQYGLRWERCGSGCWSQVPRPHVRCCPGYLDAGARRRACSSHRMSRWCSFWPSTGWRAPGVDAVEDRTHT